MSFVLSPSAMAGQTLVNYPDPLLVQWLTQLLVHPQSGQVLLMHPILYAGWIGLLVTSLNLLPASMLDGGHVVRALFGARWHRIISWVAVAAAVALRYWLMAALLVLLMTGMRRTHPGPLDDVSPVSPSRLVIGLVLVAIFVVSVVRLDISPIRF
jgi:membrane-associated protease RseP (regulator of RpoE activity)